MLPVAPGSAHAKINLHLHVTGRRGDGYHTLDSLVVFSGAADVLAVEPAETLSLEISGPFAGALRREDTESNLVLRAARALAAHAGIRQGAALRLDKRLPVASGIGGGSADAAAALRLLGALWDAPALPVADLIGLGADVPVCLRSRPVLMRGVGEELAPAPRLPPVELLLVNALVPVSTAAIFQARENHFRPAATLPDAWATAADMAHDLARLSNDLEAPACAVAPSIRAVLDAIASRSFCLLARMSGSGGTCFGLFEPGPHAAAAHRELARTGWWVWHGGLLA